MTEDDLTKKAELAFSDFMDKTDGMPFRIIGSIVASVLCLVFENMQLQIQGKIEPEEFITEFSKILRNKMQTVGLMKGDTEKIH